jgi:hypothetical protein
VSHDGYASRHQCLDGMDHSLAALQLDRLRAGLLQEPCGGSHRSGRADLVRTERQVGNDECPAGAAHDSRSEGYQFVDGHRERRIVAVDHHPGRVSDQQHGNSRLVEDGRRQRVIGGEHRPSLTARLRGGQVPDGDTPARRAAVERLRYVGLGGLWLGPRCRRGPTCGMRKCHRFLHISWRPDGVPGRIDHRTSPMYATGPRAQWVATPLGENFVGGGRWVLRWGTGIEIDTDLFRIDS